MAAIASPHPRFLAPSILAGDHAQLTEALDTVAAHFPIRWLHLDIMDGHFVPNLSFGPQTVADLRKRNKRLFFDTHLMLSHPDKYVEAFAQAGSDLICVHVEADHDIASTLHKIRELGCLRGLALNPDTPAAAVEPWLDQVELVLVMTVWPGFGGQSFISSTLPKMAELAQLRSDRGLNFRLEVDGGINTETALKCADCGVDTFVAGTAFFRAANHRQFIEAVCGPQADY